MEEQLATCWGEGQIAEFVQHNEVEAAEKIGSATLAAVACLGGALIDEIDHV